MDYVLFISFLRALYKYCRFTFTTAVVWCYWYVR